MSNFKMVDVLFCLPITFEIKVDGSLNVEITLKSTLTFKSTNYDNYVFAKSTQ